MSKTPPSSHLLYDLHRFPDAIQSKQYPRASAWISLPALLIAKYVSVRYSDSSPIAATYTPSFVLERLATMSTQKTISSAISHGSSMADSGWLTKLASLERSQLRHSQRKPYDGSLVWAHCLMQATAVARPVTSLTARLVINPSRQQIRKVTRGANTQRYRRSTGQSVVCSLVLTTETVNPYSTWVA